MKSALLPMTASNASAYTAAPSHWNNHAWLSVVPGVVITMTILGLNLMGDALRDVLDPKLSGSGRR